MDIRQIAIAVINDQSTESARRKALDYFVNNGANFWDGAVQSLLPVVFAEMKKPIYQGVVFSDTAWTAAAEVLDAEIQSAIDAKEA